MDVGDTLKEGLRIARAGERLSAMGYPIRITLEMCERVLELAPELEPEVDEIRKRCEDLVAHVEAASFVLLAKLQLATEGS